MAARPAPKKTAPAKKAVPAKKAGSAAKATPVKAASAKKAAPAKAAGAKAAPAKTAAPKKAVVAKAVVEKKVPAKKPVAAKAPAKKAAAPDNAPVKKAPTKAAASKAPAKAVPVEKKAPPAKSEFAVKARKSGTVICPLSGFEVKPDKPNLSPRTVERLRAMLVEERERHLHQADELAAEAEALAAEREGGDTQFDEESGEGDTVNVERERDLLLSASARQTVDEIDRALERIEAGNYGICLPAGRRIALERLEALPYADTCVDCKARAERRR